MAKFTALKKIKVTFFSFFHYFAINLLSVDNEGGTVDASDKKDRNKLCLMGTATGY